MRIMFTTTEPPYPDVVMGGQLDCHGLASHLAERGHRCAIAAGSIPRNHDTFWPRVDRKLDRIFDGNPVFDSLKRARSRWGNAHSEWAHEEYEGYSIYRMPPRYVLGMMPRILGTERPDVTFTQGYQREQLALLAVSHGIPSVIRVVCAEDVDWVEVLVRTLPGLSRLVSSGEIPVVSNSEFVAARAMKKLNVESPVIYPLVPLSRCVASERRSEFITFINPTPKKGVDLAIRIAALLPHRTFTFVESWRLDPKSRRALEARIAGHANIRLRPATADVRTIYASTALLLAPSQVEEAFGRVVLEACANGIPVVASDIGGIPEALGEGGLLIPATDPAEQWAQAIESVLGDPDLYGRLGAAGIAHASRAQFNVDTIVTTFAQLAESLVSRQPC
jgi:glycosyltransferase involved in cell wall biosynthesis